MKKIITLLAVLLMTVGLQAQSYATVTFNVDMSVQIDIGNFDPATDSVDIRGSFNGWGGTPMVMTDTDGDFIYTYAVDSLVVGDTVEFKFHTDPGDNWESIADNRKLGITGDTSVTYYFNNKVGGTNVEITYQADMEFEIVSGRFDPATDTLFVGGGGINPSWSKDQAIMAQNFTNPNLFEVTDTAFVGAGDDLSYKFVYVKNGVNVYENGSNKTYTVTQSDIDAGSITIKRVYNDLTLDNITNNEITVTFAVDMTDAQSSANDTPFGTVENVFVAGSVPPLAWPASGWPDTDSNQVIFLNDSGLNGDATAGDNIWSKNITFPKYSPLTVEYKYGANWSLDSNGGSNDNESASGSNHILEFTPSLWNVAVLDTFGVMGTSDFTTDVADNNGSLPQQYSLDQNYPNPFNPTTRIQFVLPKAGFVSLKVYNLLGQEVATLVNSELKAGEHFVNFNAQSLTSGIYFYSIKSGNFTATKKMLLLK